MTAFVLLSAFLLPLAMAAALAAPALAPRVLRLLPLAPLPALAAAALPGPVAVAEPWLLMGAGFGLDGTARVFLGFSAVLWAAAGWAAAAWLPKARHPLRFAACFLMAMAGNLGLITATDAPGFYAFFALMSFASYGLVIHAGTPATVRAARLYIGFVIAGELALFAGLAMAVAGAGSLALADIRAAGVSDLAAALLIAGFGAKLGVMPLHFWLPPAHGAAPAPASAVLSGAMIKAGLFGMMSVLPLGGAVLWDHGSVLMAAGLATVAGAAVLGVRESDPKAVLGFSSVGQMGLMALGLGAALKTPEAWGLIAPVLVFLAAHHALAKGALFLGAGGVLAGAGLRPLAVVALALPALALAGVPLSGGGQGKEALKAALVAGPAGWTGWLVLGVTVGTVGTTLLMLRVAQTLRRKAAAGLPEGIAPSRGLGYLLPAAGLAGLALALGPLWPRLAPEMAAGMPAAGRPALWPIATGAALAGLLWLAAEAVTLGPATLWARVAAPLRRRRDALRAALVRGHRALRVLTRRVPNRAAAAADAWRLAPAAPAMLLAAVLLLGGAAPQLARQASPPAAMPATPALPADPHAPGIGLLQGLTPVLPEN